MDDGIKWTDEHAQVLLGQAVPEAHSIGDLAVTYGSGVDGKGYWGLAYFELFAGTKRMAHLCVELVHMKVERRWFSSTFPFVLQTRLVELRLTSRIREKLARFTYGPFANYRMEFDPSGSDELEGRMVLDASNKCVGAIRARRVR